MSTWPRKKRSRETQLVAATVDYLLWERQEVIRVNGLAVAMGEDTPVEEINPYIRGSKSRKRFVKSYTWFGKIGQKKSSGISDMFVIGDTGLFFLEAKTPEGTLTQDQKEWINMCHKYGVDAYVYRSVEEVRDIMKERRARISITR